METTTTTTTTASSQLAAATEGESVEAADALATASTEEESVEAADALGREPISIEVESVKDSLSKFRMDDCSFSSSARSCISGIWRIKSRNKARLCRPESPTMPQSWPISLAAAHPWT